MCIEENEFCEEAENLLNYYAKEKEHIRNCYFDAMEEAFKVGALDNKIIGIIEFAKKFGFETIEENDNLRRITTYKLVKQK